MRVAILYICTGAYDVFWKEFYLSFEKYFLPDSEVEYYVFTDAASIYDEENAKVHKIYQKNLGWPYDTMMRFHIFLKAEEALKTYDYLFFMNANLICKEYIYENEFLPQKKGLLVVKHPGFWDKSPNEFTYDRNKRSTAYIPYGEGTYYVFGAVNGGKTADYLQMVHELKKRTDIDLKNNVIPLWHDESQINRFIYESDNFELLDPSYCYPEGWNLPFFPKMLLLDKSKIIDVNSIKKGKGFKERSANLYRRAKESLVRMKVNIRKWRGK